MLATLLMIAVIAIFAVIPFEVIGRRDGKNRVRIEGKSFELTDEELETYQSSGALPLGITQPKKPIETFDDRLSRLEGKLQEVDGVIQVAPATPVPDTDVLKAVEALAEKVKELTLELDDLRAEHLELSEQVQAFLEEEDAVEETPQIDPPKDVLTVQVPLVVKPKPGAEEAKAAKGRK